MKAIAFCWFLFVVYCGINNRIQGTTDVILSDVQSDDNQKDSENTVEEIDPEPFIPTHEWQVVKENQAVPAGLHIRMNFQTHVKEAKILDKSESAGNNRKSGDNKKHSGPNIIIRDEGKHLHDFQDTDEKLYFTKSHLKHALHEFRDKVGTKDIVDDITWSDDAKDAIKEAVVEKPVKQKFRSMKEIREELEDKMGWKIKSDVEVMKEHTKFLLDEKHSVEEKAATLDGLEDYVHQIDNAKDLDRIGAMEVIVHLLNDSNAVLQQNAANVLGAATQNNKDAQDAVLRHGGLPFLLLMIQLEKPALTKKKGLYALSALVRGNSEAQKELVKLNGITNVLDIIKESNAGSLRIKGVMLLSDLIAEQKQIMLNLVESGKKDPSERSPLLNLLIEKDWCNLLIPLFNTTDYDTKEKLIEALEISVNECKATFQSKTILEVLLRQADVLRNDIRKEEDADFKSYLEGLLTQLNKNIIERLT